MGERAEFMRAIRTAETGTAEGNYSAIRGQVRDGARLIGAYGFASDEWPRLAAEAGYPGARWQDRSAQDAVATFIFDALFQKYQDWGLVAIAWKAGEAAADKLAEHPEVLEGKGLEPLRAYRDKVLGAVIPSDSPDSPLRGARSPISGPQAPQTPELQAPPMRAGLSERADNTLRGILTAMRDQQRSMAASPSDIRMSEQEGEVV